MKILLLSPWFPAPAFGGALIRVLETLRYLARRHDVTLLAPAETPPAAEHVRTIADLGVQVVAVPVPAGRLAAGRRIGEGLFRGRSLLQGLHFSGPLAHELRRQTATHRFDVVHVEHSFMSPYLDWIHHLTSHSRRVLTMHNVESLRFRREARVGGWTVRRAALAGDTAMFGTWEEQAVRRFDGVAVVSPLERDWVRQHAPTTPVAIVSNGVDVEYFRATRRGAPHPALVFSGLMNYPPNIDAAVWFCDEVLPLVAQRFPDVRLSIVGDKPTAAVRRLSARRGVTVTGRVADVRPHLANAAAVIPLRSGAGTRLKILEAMSMQCPVVSTALGAEGLDVTPGANILIDDTPAGFANAVCAVLSNAEYADRLGREARRFVEARYNWARCLRGLDELYDRIGAAPVASGHHERRREVVGL